MKQSTGNFASAGTTAYNFADENLYIGDDTAHSINLSTNFQVNDMHIK
jgi:hypothetical protein